LDRLLHLAGMPQNEGRVRNLIGAKISVSAEALRRAEGFAKLGRREAGGAIIGSVAESCEETEFCTRAAQLHPGGYVVRKQEFSMFGRDSVPHGDILFADAE
jgi:hypothetical protein